MLGGFGVVSMTSTGRGMGWVCFLGCLGLARAGVGQSAEDDAAGWGSDSRSEVEVEPVSRAPEQRALRLDLALRERAGFWMERAEPSRLSQLRSSLEASAAYSRDFTLDGAAASVRAAAGLRGEYDAAYLFARDAYAAETLRAYELRLIPLEMFVGLKVGMLELRSGRMISVLGQGELQSAVDVLNPRDLRQVGLTDLDRIRLPMWTTRISLSDASVRLEAFIVHEAYFGILPPLLGRFSPVRKLLTTPSGGSSELGLHAFRVRHVPEGFHPPATQFVGRYGFTGSGLDLDVYAGSVLDQLGVAALPPPDRFRSHTVQLDLYHPRYTLVALAGAKTIADWVLRFELAANLRRTQSVRNLTYAVPVIEARRYTQLTGLIGVTYFGLTDINLGAELMQSYVLDNPARERGSQRALLWPVEAPSLSLRYQHLLFNQRFQLSLLGLFIGIAPFNGALISASFAYFPRDGLALRIEYAHYEASSHFGYFYGFEDNDRLDLSLAWSVSVL